MDNVIYDSSKGEPKSKNDASKILQDMATTFKERNKVYGDNYKTVGIVMSGLFPDGVNLKTIDDYNTWHLFELMIVKLTRFANTNLTHRDSIHDAAVYAAMIESLIPEEDKSE
jgi:hypothetical protein|tara:strand:+ start:9608 stop:9946 length:339 start_codon:yes stop_codon:yes gene_type:complete